MDYKYLIDIKLEVKDDIKQLERRIKRLKKNIEEQKAALNTKNIRTLPLDSIYMVMDRINISIDVKNLTFNRMKNLRLKELSRKDSLRTQINNYYNTSQVFFNRAVNYYISEFKKYSDFLMFEEDLIEFTHYEFPLL